MIGAKLFGAILLASGFVGAQKVGTKTRHFWTTGANRFGYGGTEHSEWRVARAVEKRARRVEILRRNVDAGAYGLRPFVGQKGYMANTPQNCAIVSPFAPVSFVIHELQVR